MARETLISESDWMAFLDREEKDAGYIFSNERLDDFDLMLWYWLDGVKGHSCFSEYLTELDEVAKQAGKATRAQRDFIRLKVLNCHYKECPESYRVARKAIIYFLGNDYPGFFREFCEWKEGGGVFSREVA